ncbi:hypothetical protein [Bosea sp. BIWAKO-01]|uniref:hypothetical protein n=1 Tax=Bosea sp. BIWAKO-01 TaxID=506668 RepID=UPI00114CAAE9|nr:hypothetical protein [Bosea sp. BIWAKO-01]
MKMLFLATATLAVVSLSVPAKAGPLPSQREQWLNTPNYSLECENQAGRMTIDIMPSEWRVRLTNPADGKVWLVPIVEASIGYRSFAASNTYNRGRPMPFVQYIKLGAADGYTRIISDDHGRVMFTIMGTSPSPFASAPMSVMLCS